MGVLGLGAAGMRVGMPPVVGTGNAWVFQGRWALGVVDILVQRY